MDSVTAGSAKQTWSARVSNSGGADQFLQAGQGGALSDGMTPDDKWEIGGGSNGGCTSAIRHAMIEPAAAG